MDVGMTVVFQHPNYLEDDHQAPVGVSDSEVYRLELGLAELAEPMGFDSLWGVEHHFTGYTMCPDVLQYLAYMAGRTTRIRLGSMVVVLPWHNPVRVADAVSMLDNISGGRFTFGIGRGLGRIEFDGFNVPMDESRTRFVESAELVLEALERGYVEYDGTCIKQPRRWLRPAPLRSFRGRTYAAAVSPESVEIMARLGVGILISPQKPWETVIGELNSYRDTFRRIHQSDPPSTIVACPVFCDEDEGRANELGEHYIGRYYATVLKHYELGGDHFSGMQAYDYYAKSAELMRRTGLSTAERFYAQLQVYGTPDQCIEKIANIRDMVGCQEFIGYFSYGGMAPDEVHRNLSLFNDKIQPRLKAM